MSTMASTRVSDRSGKRLTTKSLITDSGIGESTREAWSRLVVDFSTTEEVSITGAALTTQMVIATKKAMMKNFIVLSVCTGEYQTKGDVRMSLPGIGCRGGAELLYLYSPVQTELHLSSWCGLFQLNLTLTPSISIGDDLLFSFSFVYLANTTEIEGILACGLW